MRLGNTLKNAWSFQHQHLRQIKMHFSFLLFRRLFPFEYVFYIQYFFDAEKEF